MRAFAIHNGDKASAERLYWETRESTVITPSSVRLRLMASAPRLVPRRAVHFRRHGSVGSMREGVPMTSIDQSRVVSARAVGLLRMKQRMDNDKTATKTQVVALEKMIKEIPEADLAKAKEYLDFERVHKPSQGPPTQPGPNIALGPQKVTKPAQMTLKSDDVAALLSGSRTSSFRKVYSAFSDYESEQDPDKKHKYLQALQLRAERWVNEHKESKDPLDAERRKLLAQLVDQTGTEQARSSKGKAEQRYMGNIATSKGKANYQSEDPDERYAFKALTMESASDVKKNVIGKQKAISNPYGLTDAELAAIRIFTGPDYGYINPATANSAGWLQANKDENMGSGFSRGGVEDSDYKSEGVVHVGVAMSGLLKVPAYGGDVYRGVSATQADLDGWKKNGFRFDALGSASTDRAQAESFAEKNVKADKPIQVIMVLHNAGGRDVKDISVAPKESEVTILPGSRFTAKSTQRLPDSPKGPVYQLELDKA
jgi:hypothetical protein